MKFTQDWFTYNIPSIEGLFKNREKPQKILEIGCFEGRATCWFMQNILHKEGEIVCIDTFKGGLEHQKMDFSGTREAFTNNTKEACGPSQSIVLMEGQSFACLADLLSEGDLFDFIYIDGSHAAPDVLTDACMAYHLAEKGSLILFDDYLWGADSNPLHTPKVAVDTWSHIFHGKVQMTLLGIQVAFKKL